MSGRISIWQRIRWRFSHWTWENFKKQFQVVEHVPSYERDEEYLRQNQNQIMYDQENERMTGPVEESWDKLREWCTKGLSGGLIAALTLAGSQTYSDNLGTNVFWLISCFMVGLAALMFRQLAIIRHRDYDRSGTLSDFAADYPYSAPPYLMSIARIMDWLALISLMIGACWGVYVLHHLTRSSVTP